MQNIAYITDIHLDEQFPKDLGVDARKNWQLLLKDVAERNIDEIIFGGDIGEPASNKWFFTSLIPFKSKIIAGNHDQFSEIVKYYHNPLMAGHQELYYAYEEHFFKYIFLDSSSAAISPTQLAWFQVQLNTTKKILLFIHHPILAVNTIIDKLYPLKNRETLKSMLLAFKNEVFIFCGHYHLSDEKKENNITQLVTLAASYQIERGTETLKTNTKHFGYRMIKINNDNIQSELIEKRFPMA